jgi:two-component system cell cycle sensor histidine kinase/response regulator CckA
MTIKNGEQHGTAERASNEPSNLRRRAEARVVARESHQSAEVPAGEARRLLHELRVHEAELEMQNEELRVAQEALEVSRARYFDLYDLAPVGYVTLSEQGAILETNLAAATLLGVPRGVLLHQPLTRWVQASDQDVFYRLRKALFETGEPQECELRFTGHGGALCWVRIEATRGEETERSGAVWRATLSDITDRKRAEEDEKKLGAQLAQARKMESIGRLAGGVAHDFNNMLAVILGNVELAQEQVALGEPIQAELEEIRKAADRSAVLTRQLLAFARKQPVAPRVLDLNDAIADALTMIERLIGENIELRWKPGGDLWRVRMDPVQIGQILANLALNARDAIGGVGTVSIETANVVLDEVFCRDRDECTPGEYVRIAVTDNGSGMSREVVGQLFEPFFTTKHVGFGTGLGLATVLGMVKQNGGVISVESARGQGSTFAICLPRWTGDGAAIPAAAAAPPPKGQGEAVLLVEDQAMILRLGKAMLERLGYAVLAAATPAEAIRLAEIHPGGIDLVLTDVVMPERNGRDLVERLRAVRPGLRSLFMSGYTSDIIANQRVLDEGVQFIQKPFSMQELAKKVSEALART